VQVAVRVGVAEAEELELVEEEEERDTGRVELLYTRAVEFADA